MKEGYWINYNTNKMVEMPEHEIWIRNPKNAKSFGVPDNVHKMASQISDREKYLLFLMQHAPIMRVRGHGTNVAFQFATHNRQDAMDAILMWGKKNAGPFTWMSIDNFATKENTEMQYADFEKYMDEGGAEAILRVAKATNRIPLKASVLRELLAISKRLIE
jgi:hypothetical protein